MTKISLIIPCNNGQRTVARTLESILKQTFTQFEVIIIDDGSTDNTYEIIKGYSKKDDRIKVIHLEKNGGVSAARNTGLGYVQGEYVQFIDADDELLPDALETLYTTITKENADVAVCNFKGNPMFLSYMEDCVYDMSNEDDVLRYYEDTFQFLLPWNKLFKKEILTPRFDTEIAFAEDEVFNLAVLSKLKKVACIGKPLYIYHYAPAEDIDPNEIVKKSCLNEVIEQTRGNKKNSIWFLFDLLTEKRKAILNNDFKNNPECTVCCSDTDNILYARLFDFLFAELSAFEYNCTPVEIVYDDFINIFREKNFIDSIKIQEKYGFKFTDAEGEELDELIAFYINSCRKFYTEMRENNLDLKIYNVFIQLFFKVFCEKAEATCNNYNRLMDVSSELDSNSTKEAVFVNNMNLSCVCREIAAILD